MNDLLNRLRAYTRQMAPHQRNREAGRLLIEAADWIEAREKERLDAAARADERLNPFRELA